MKIASYFAPLFLLLASSGCRVDVDRCEPGHERGLEDGRAVGPCRPIADAGPQDAAPPDATPTDAGPCGGRCEPTHCVDGSCVACTEATEAEDCGDESFCVEGACVACRTSADCNGSAATMACIEGACGPRRDQLASGCSSSREGSPVPTAKSRPKSASA